MFAEHNIIRHSGYKIADLYVNQKHPSLKAEVLNYDYLGIDQYNKHIITKALMYNNTKYIKSMKAKFHFIPPYYDIPAGSVISLSHIISVILYTDYTKLSADFSSTFRKHCPFDTLQNIKQRNEKYWWMSKLLRETVEIFGDCSRGDGNDLIGPFYCGLSKVINVSNFFLRLSSPTSTSKRIEVAIKFSGYTGMILKLNNPLGNKQCRYLRGFDCSMISRHPEEDERYILILYLVCNSKYSCKLFLF